MILNGKQFDTFCFSVLLDLLRQGVSPEALYSFLKKAETESLLGQRLIKKSKSKHREERNRKARSEIIIGCPVDKSDREEEKQV